MFSKPKKQLNKDNLDFYLKAFAKEFRKFYGKNAEVELVVVGGASVILNYSFRNMTLDIDVIDPFMSDIRTVIHAVSDQYDLQDDWMNFDFMNTSSFNQKLRGYSTYYKSFSNVKIYTVKDECLIAMKLVSGRQYKNDMADIVGILLEHEIAGDPLNFEKIDKAMCNIYGDWNFVKPYVKMQFDLMLENKNLDDLYQSLLKKGIEKELALESLGDELTVNDDVDQVLYEMEKSRNEEQIEEEIMLQKM